MPWAESDWDDAPPLNQDRLAEVLADPASWGGVPDTDARSVRIATAGQRPLKRPIKRSQPESTA
jgi:hypothetical protein